MEVPEKTIARLQVFLSAIEDHLRCVDKDSETHHYYPQHCLDAILYRYEHWEIDKILLELERILTDE